MYTVEVSKNVIKFLEKNKGQPIVIQLEKSLHMLMKNPLDATLDIKKLKGFAYQYRLRIGDYRLIYEVCSGKFVVYCIDIGVRGGI